jgi:hypothetical protein
VQGTAKKKKSHAGWIEVISQERDEGRVCGERDFLLRGNEKRARERLRRESKAGVTKQTTPPFERWDGRDAASGYFEWWS